MSSRLKGRGAILLCPDCLNLKGQGSHASGFRCLLPHTQRIFNESGPIHPVTSVMGRDVGWRTFLNMLDYKSKLYGKVFVTVDPKNTTQTCSNCGFVMGTGGTEKLTLSDRKWTCPHCGIHHIRDWNAAKNILQRGLQKRKEQTA